jgi:hypothetical protein
MSASEGLYTIISLPQFWIAVLHGGDRLPIFQ